MSATMPNLNMVKPVTFQREKPLRDGVRLVELPAPEQDVSHQQIRRAQHDEEQALGLDR